MALSVWIGETANSTCHPERELFVNVFYGYENSNGALNIPCCHLNLELSLVIRMITFLQKESQEPLSVENLTQYWHEYAVGRIFLVLCKTCDFLSC